MAETCEQMTMIWLVLLDNCVVLFFMPSLQLLLTVQRERENAATEKFRGRS